MLPVEFKLFQQDDEVDSVKGSTEIILCMKTWNLRKKRKNYCTCVACVGKITNL